MKKSILFLVLLTLCLQAVRAQTVFGFETASVVGPTITETITDITVTLSGDPDLELFDPNGFGGTNGMVALTQNTITSVTFTFDQPLVVNSIIAIESFGNSVDYTFTPTGGSNSPVTVSLTDGAVPTINLNWVNVTSFTVTAAGAAFGFDDLSVDTGTNSQTFFEWETANNAGGTITETVNNIGVTVAGDASYAVTDYGGASGTSGNVILSNANRTAITFTFDQAVVVNSILALEGTGANIDYTFTPTGGNNAPVEASLVSGVTAVPLNWFGGVTSFTVTSSGGQFGFDNLSVTGIESTTIFDFDTNASFTIIDECEATNRSSFAEETIDGITVTVYGGDEDDCNFSATIRASSSGGDTTGFVANRGGRNASPMIVAFSKPVVLNSLLPNDRLGDDLLYNVDFTFTPIGGNNSSVIAPIILGISPVVHLNWVNITGFTITPSIDANIQIDDMSVNALIPLSVSHHQNASQVTVYPNPVDNILYIKNNSPIKSVTLYSLLGQEILQSKEAEINVSQVSKGMYLLQIETSEGMETKRIIKK